MIDDEKLVQEYLPKWLNFACDPDDLKLEIIAGDVIRIYENLGTIEPQIIFCRGPMEQLLLPTLVDLMLRMGEEKSSALKFHRLPNAPEVVHQEWANLWSVALNFIDWKKIQRGATSPGTGCGVLIADRIQRMLAQRMRPPLVATADQALGHKSAHTAGEQIEDGVGAAVQ